MLTSVGGVLGVLMGSAIGLLVNLVSGFPVSLPWWSFALGLGFSASVGVFFGMLPAWRAVPPGSRSKRCDTNSRIVASGRTQHGLAYDCPRDTDV